MLDRVMTNKKTNYDRSKTEMLLKGVMVKIMLLRKMPVWLVGGVGGTIHLPYPKNELGCGPTSK